MRKVAFFDIDGTVFRSSLLIELVETLIRTGVFPQSAEESYRTSYQAWKNREGDYETYIWDVVRVFEAHIKGVHYGVLKDVGRSIVVEKGRHTYCYTRDLIQELKEKDYAVVAISQSPKGILDEFCASHGFDKVYGRIYELGPRDCFTGVITDVELIKDKAKIIDRFIAQGDYTLEGSVGVGDTDGDISFLAMVEKPICFNPNMKLYEYAKEKGWSVVIERKDVVYRI